MPNLTSQDGALSALDAASKAESHFFAIANRNENTDTSVELLLAEASWLRASEQFADTVPTTATGAIAKILAVEDLLSDIPLAESSLEIRHLRAVIRYLERQPTRVTGRRRRNPVSAE